MRVYRYGCGVEGEETIRIIAKGRIELEIRVVILSSFFFVGFVYRV